MRRTRGQSVSVPMAFVLLSMGLGACSSSAGGSGGSDGSSQDAATCVGDPTANASLMREDCGVFVRADATGASEDGSQAKPYKTLAKAIANAKGKFVFACSATPFVEALTLTTPVELYGGFDCSRWTYDATKKTVLTATADTIPVTSSATGAALHDFAITAADASVWSCPQARRFAWVNFPMASSSGSGA